MWQASISTDQTQTPALDNISRRIFPVVCRKGGVLVRDEMGTRPRITVACSESACAEVRMHLNDEIVEVITNVYKRNYILEHTKLPIASRTYLNAYVQALVCFDRVYERELVLQKIPHYEIFNIDGFFHFRLRELLSRWQEICDLAAMSGSYLVSTDTFFELINFLVSTVDSRCHTAEIQQHGEGYFVRFFDSCKHLICTQEAEDENLSAALIDFSPTAVLYDGEVHISRENKQLIDNLFCE